MNVVAVIPTLNESVREVDGLCQRLYKMGVIPRAIVPGHNDDRTLTIPSYTQPGRGTGDAYRDGFRRVLCGRWATHILMLDADGEADIDTVPRMLACARSTDADVVVASRWLPSSRFIGYRRDKLALNWVFNKLARVALSSPVHDHTFTFKLLKREVVEAFGWTADRQDIGSQTTMWPIAAGYRVVEVPTIWRARSGKSPATLSLAGNLRHVRAAAQAVAMRWGMR